MISPRTAARLTGVLLLALPLAACNEAANRFIERCKDVTNAAGQCGCAASAVAAMMGDEDFEVLTLILQGQRGAAEMVAGRMGMSNTLSITGKWSLASASAGRICNIVGLDRM